MADNINRMGENLRPAPVNYEAGQNEISKLIKPENKELDNAVSKNEGKKKIGDYECETCKNRKYVDGSNDMGVSFKTPQHVSPEASFAAVSAHEQEHVSAAKAEGSEPGKKLVSSTVQLKTAVCPECGRVYVAGGTTTTQMRYEDPKAKEDDSYKEGLKGLSLDQKF